MVAAGWIYVVTLAYAQITGDFARLPPIDESLPFPSLVASEVQPTFYPEFGLPQPTAPPPAPALAAEDAQLPATRVTVGWLPAFGGQGFGMTDLDVNHTFLFGYDDLPPLNITPGLGLHLWSGPVGLDLPPRVYDAYLDFHWRPIDGDRFGLSLGITPGLYGDFESLDRHTFQVTGWGLGNWRLGPAWNLLGGLAYVRQLRSHFLPVGGLIWTPNDETRLELVIPKPRFVRRFRSDDNGSAFGYVAGQLGGGAWAVADTPIANVLVSYNDLRLLVGLEFIHVSGREWNLETGYVFARHLTIDDNAASSPSDTIVLQMSAAY